MAFLAQSLQVFKSVSTRWFQVVDFQLFCASTLGTTIVVPDKDMGSTFQPFCFASAEGSVPCIDVRIFHFIFQDWGCIVFQVWIVQRFPAVLAMGNVTEHEQVDFLLPIFDTPVLPVSLTYQVLAQDCPFSSTLMPRTQPYQHPLTHIPVQLLPDGR